MSGLRSILVHLDAAPASEARLQTALDLAPRHDARLTAWFAVGAEAAPPAFAYSAGAALSALESQPPPHQSAREALRRRCAESRPEIAWCEFAGDGIGKAFLAEAAYADLLLLGRPAARGEEGGAPSGFLETAILDSGTPALVVPALRFPGPIGTRVLVAWNGSLPSARALRGALPLLERAEQVDVVSWAAAPPAAPFSRLDVVAFLKRHGIAARAHLRAPRRSIGDALAALAVELGADLVVMGCYGHSRARERLFGGATRSALATLPIPILMAH